MVQVQSRFQSNRFFCRYSHTKTIKNTFPPIPFASFPFLNYIIHTEKQLNKVAWNSVQLQYRYYRINELEVWILWWSKFADCVRTIVLCVFVCTHINCGAIEGFMIGLSHSIQFGHTLANCVAIFFLLFSLASCCCCVCSFNRLTIMSSRVTPDKMKFNQIKNTLFSECANATMLFL